MKLKIILPIVVCMIAFSSCKKDDSYKLNPLYDTWVKNLLPNHSYLLQRAVNPIADITGCSSNSWLTLGEGLQPKSIITNSHGEGSANLWRDISGIAPGTAFHIRFRILDEATMVPVLSSDCYDYTAR